MKSTIQSSKKKIFCCLPRLLMPALASVIFTTSEAQVGSSPLQAVDYHEMSKGQEVQSVEVRGDVTIVLTNALSTNILLEGNNKDIAAVKTTVKNGILQINAEKKKGSSKLTVYLTVNNIHSINVTGNAQIFSSGVLVDNLEITVNGDSFVKVYHQGQLKVTAGDGYELDVAMNTKR